LHIEGATNSEVLKIEADANPFIRWVQNGTDVGFLQFLGGSAYLSNMSNGTLFFRTNNTDKMVITSIGNVGIGTTSPAAKLEISETGTTAAALYVDTARYGIVVIGDGTSNSQYLLNLQGDGGSTNAMVVQSSGNVGIGTIDPDYKLDVAGAIGINTYIHHNDDTDTFIGFASVDNFQVTVANTKELDVSAGIVGITNTLKYDNPTANSEFNGEIVNFGSFLETTAAGDLICLGTDAGAPVWRLANNGNSVDSTGMLGIAMGSSPDDGILVRGHARLAGYSVLADGGKCYISSTNGDMTTTAPSGSGNYLRIVGYVVDQVALSYGHIYFCPDNTWTEIA